MKEALQHTIKAFIRKGEKYYIAECLEIPVVTQGKTRDEAAANLKEAVELHLEGEDPGDIALIEKAKKAKGKSVSAKKYFVKRYKKV